MSPRRAAILALRFNGFTVLEGNNFPDVNLMQVHQPLLSDPRVRRFYAHHRVL